MDNKSAETLKKEFSKTLTGLKELCEQRISQGCSHLVAYEDFDKQVEKATKEYIENLK